MKLDFAEAASETFAFLMDAGFVQTDATDRSVEYRKGLVRAAVYFDPRSYEVSFSIGYAGENYSVSEIIRLADNDAGNDYRDYAVTSQESLMHGLVWLKNIVNQFGGRALAGDPVVFESLKSQRKTSSEEYALEILARQVRPNAHEAFRNGNYKMAADLYGKIESQLSVSEGKKLALARERSRRFST